MREIKFRVWRADDKKMYSPKDYFYIATDGVIPSMAVEYPNYLYQFYGSEQPTFPSDCEVIGNIYQNPNLLEESMQP